MRGCWYVNYNFGLALNFKVRCCDAVQAPATENSIYLWYFLLTLEKLNHFAFDWSLSRCDVQRLLSNPECCIVACCFLTSIMCSPSELYSKVLCYCVIHHTAARCSQQLLTCTMLMDIYIYTDSVWRVRWEYLRYARAICCIPHFIPGMLNNACTAFFNKWH